MNEAFGASHVEEAAARIRAHVRPTPVLHSSSLDEIAGVRVVLKAENLQRTGSFKARGAFNAVLQTTAADRAAGVLAVSSGNHAQAVALAARECGTRAVVVMPEDANPVKVAATRAYGAEVIQHGVTADNREDFVRTLAAERKLPLIHPFDDWRVMAGQGTAGLELSEQAAPAGLVVCPVGGGGLLSGFATAVKHRWPGCRVVGVEPQGADDVRASLAAGRPVGLDRAPETIVDGVRTLCVGERPFTVINRLVDEVVVVPDEVTLQTMELIWQRTKSVVEPAGALALAALLSGAVARPRAPASGEPCVAVMLSGGNVDLDLWARLRSRDR